MDYIESITNQRLANNSFLSSYDIREFIAFLTCKYKLESYIQSIQVEKGYGENMNGIGQYDQTNKIITVSFSDLNEEIASNYYDYGIDSTGILYNEFAINLQLSTIYHEVRHAIQMQQCYEKANTENKIICKSILEESFNISEEQYHDGYGVIPIERDAEVFASMKAYDIFRKSSYISEKNNNFFKNICLSVLQHGYDQQGRGPLRKFYTEVLAEPQKYYTYNSMASALPLLYKLQYGFDIMEDELKYLKEGIIHTNREDDIVKVLMKKR